MTTIAMAHVENLGSPKRSRIEKGDVYAGLSRAARPSFRTKRRRQPLDRGGRAYGATLVRFGRRRGMRSALLKFDMDETGSTAEAEILGCTYPLSHRRRGARIGR